MGSVYVEQSFRILEHTADVGFEAWGETREQVFRNAGRALMGIVVDLDSVSAAESIAIETRAGGPEDLLVNWLSEILYLRDAEGWLFHDFEIEMLTERTIRGRGRGERFDRSRHRIKLLVKAITYHELVLHKQPDGEWRAQVYVDI